MNIHDATETSYKNGYEAGVKEFAEKLFQRLAIYETAFEEVQDWSARNTIQQIVQEVKELTKKGGASNE